MSTYSAIKNTSFDVIRPPDYDNKATRSAATDYQAGENGYLVIFWTGSYRNGGRIFVGPNTSSYTTVYENGDDINNNTKGAGSMIVVPKSYYYKFTVDGVYAEGWENATAYWVPEAS